MKKNGKKQNPLLAAYEAKLEANYQRKLEINSEFDYMAFLMVVHDEFKVGPGRADKLLDKFIAKKVEIAQKIIEDSEGDKEILHTKRDIAWVLKSIFGPEKWAKYRGMFQLVWEYWNMEQEV